MTTAGILVLGLVAAGVMTLAMKRTSLLVLIAFATAAFPKAGVKPGSFPVPFMLFGLFLGLLVMHHRYVKPREPSGVLPPLLLLYALWMIWRFSDLLIGGAPIIAVVAFAAWTLPPPLIIYYSESSRRFVPPDIQRLWARSMEAGVMAACVFSLVQVVIGIRETAIQGLTIAWGDQYLGKPINIRTVDSGVFSKIPSTYQNGNILGVATGFFLIIAIIRLQAHRREGGREGGRESGRRVWDVSLLGLTAVASVLSASRTVVIGIGLAVVILLLQSRRPARVVQVLTLGVLSVWLAIRLQPGLVQRFSFASVTDTDAAGRTEVWQEVIPRSGVMGLTFGTDYWAVEATRAGEGLVGVMNRLGLIGAGLVFAMVRRATRTAREWRVPLVVVAVSVLIDSSYLVFPTLFLPFARMWAPLDVDRARPRPAAAREIGSSPRNRRHDVTLARPAEL